MSKVVLGVSGPIKSGKSTLARALGRALGWKVCGFGDAVRAEARRRGITESRATLQALGEELVAHDSAGLCGAALAQAEWVAGAEVVIDGVRHRRVLEDLWSLVRPAELMLVYVNVPDSVRVERASPSGISPEALWAMDQHSTEVEVRTALRRLADLEVDGCQPVEDLVAAVRSRLGD